MVMSKHCRALPRQPGSEKDVRRRGGVASPLGGRKVVVDKTKEKKRRRDTYRAHSSRTGLALGRDKSRDIE